MFTHTLVLLLPNEANRKVAQGVETEVLKRRFHLRRRFSSNEAKKEREVTRSSAGPEALVFARIASVQLDVDVNKTRSSPLTRISCFFCSLIEVT